MFKWLNDKPKKGQYQVRIFRGKYDEDRTTLVCDRYNLNVILPEVKKQVGDLMANGHKGQVIVLDPKMNMIAKVRVTLYNTH